KVVVSGPGLIKAEQRVEAVVDLVVGISVASPIAVEGTDPGLPGRAREGIAEFDDGCPGVVLLVAVAAAELINHIEVVVEAGVADKAVTAQRGTMNVLVCRAVLVVDLVAQVIGL